VVHLRVWNGASLDPHLKLTTTTSGSCWVTSNVTGRKDAYRCMAGNDIYDPCFAAPSGDRVGCPLSGTDVTVLTVADPLPEPDLRGVATVWMIVLNDGTRCARSSGAGPDPRNGLDATMYCKNNAIVWGEPDTAKPIWTVKVSPDEKGRLSTVTVAQAFE
jgi:hypothetical protein